MKWYNPCEFPFQIAGFPFWQEDKCYKRVPLSSEGIIPDAVYGLADETAGGQIRFHAKLKSLKIRVSLASKPGFYSHVPAPHLADVTKRAFDLYLSKNGNDYVFYNLSDAGNGSGSFYESELIAWEEAQEYDFLLNFPLYGGVDRILIGVDEEAQVSSPRYQFKTHKKLVIYGTSIQQGGCAGRPGMAQSNLLSRWLDQEVYNLGFNSSGKGETEVAEYISQIADMSALVMSIEGNCPSASWLEEHLKSFISCIRTSHKTLPIVVMPFIMTGRDFLYERDRNLRLTYREIQRRIVTEFQKAGDEHIYFFLQEGNDTQRIPQEVDGHSVWHECTVDGLHYNDLGFYWMTELLYQFLKKIIDL